MMNVNEIENENITLNNISVRSNYSNATIQRELPSPVESVNNSLEEEFELRKKNVDYQQVVMMNLTNFVNSTTFRDVPEATLKIAMALMRIFKWIGFEERDINNNEGGRSVSFYSHYKNSPYLSQHTRFILKNNRKLLTLLVFSKYPNDLIRLGSIYSDDTIVIIHNITPTRNTLSICKFGILVSKEESENISKIFSVLEADETDSFPSLGLEVPLFV